MNDLAPITLNPGDRGSSADFQSRSTLLIVPEIFSSEGGIPRILRLYLRALCDLARPQDKISLVALNDPTFAPRELHEVAHGRINETRACNRGKIRFIKETIRLGRRSDRIVCGHISQLPVALAARIFNPRLEYDLVAHGIEVWRPLRFWEKVALRRVRRVYCVSDYTRSELLRRCPLPEGRARVLPNALDPAFPICRGRPRNTDAPPVILVVARLTRADRDKGVADVIAALPAVLSALPQTRLQIIGRGDALPDLIAQARLLGVQESVEFLGYVEDAALADALRNCTLFALPSGKEGFGLVFIEAMACGRPCLGARAGGIPEVITSESGILVEFGDIPGIAAACLDALQRPWDEAAILARASEFAYPHFRRHLDDLLRA